MAYFLIKIIQPQIFFLMYGIHSWKIVQNQRNWSNYFQMEVQWDKVINAIPCNFTVEYFQFGNSYMIILMVTPLRLLKLKRYRFNFHELLVRLKKHNVFVLSYERKTVWKNSTIYYWRGIIKYQKPKNVWEPSSNMFFIENIRLYRNFSYLMTQISDINF